MRRERILCCGVQPVGAVVESDAGKAFRIGVSPAADAVARLEHDEILAGRLQCEARRKPCSTCANDGDIIVAHLLDL